MLDFFLGYLCLSEIVFAKDGGMRSFGQGRKLKHRRSTEKWTSVHASCALTVDLRVT